MLLKYFDIWLIFLIRHLKRSFYYFVVLIRTETECFERRYAIQINLSKDKKFKFKFKHFLLLLTCDLEKIVSFLCASYEYLPYFFFFLFWNYIQTIISWF